MIAFENDTGNHSGKVKHIGGGATARRMSKKANEAAFAISLEPELMLENNTAFGDLGNKLEDGGRKARPLWPVSSIFKFFLLKKNKFSEFFKLRPIN